MNLLSQIKNLIEDIENSHSKNISYLRHTELVKLILLNLPILDNDTINSMAKEDMLSDIFYEYNESSKIILDFFSKNLSFMEDDLKDSDFEKELVKNVRDIDLLKQEVIKKREDYIKLKELENDKKDIMNQILELESSIKEFNKIDLEQIKSQKEKLENQLNYLIETEGENLVRYKKHLEENDFINIKTEELNFISSEISEKLIEMDDLYKNILDKRK